MGAAMLGARVVNARAMRGMPIRAVLWIASLLYSVCVGAPLNAAGPDWPAGFVIEENVRLLRINGLDVHSRALASPLAPDSACALLERQWRAASASELVGQCRRAGSWYVITHPNGNVLETAQFQAGSRGSVGFVSVVDPLAAPAGKPGARLPLPAGTRVVNVVQSIESGDLVTQFTLLLPYPLNTALAKLRAAAAERGWQSIQAKGSSVIDFQRASVSARALAMRAPSGTAVVLVEHDSPGQAR